MTFDYISWTALSLFLSFLMIFGIIMMIIGAWMIFTSIWDCLIIAPRWRKGIIVGTKVKYYSSMELKGWDYGIVQEIGFGRQLVRLSIPNAPTCKRSTDFIGVKNLFPVSKREWWKNVK